MRVLLIDDHTLFAQGLKFLLAELNPQLDAVVAGSLAAALTQSGNFDLVMLDFHLPDSHGLQALAQVRQALEGVPVVVLSGEEKLDIIHAVIEAGASGFVPKSSTPAVLLAALRLILAGGTYLPPQLLNAIHGGTPATRMPPAGTGNSASWSERLGLTERQLEVLLKAVQGKSNKIIARETGLAEGTVKAHLSAAFRVLGVANRTEAVFRAAQLGLAAGAQRAIGSN
jgi:DNA-binding NarL/FixJ family response regulator